LDKFQLVHITCVKMIFIISEHLTCLKSIIEDYFLSVNVDEFYCIRNPFEKLTDTNFALSEEEEWAYLCSDRET